MFTTTIVDVSILQSLVCCCVSSNEYAWGVSVGVSVSWACRYFVFIRC